MEHLVAKLPSDENEQEVSATIVIMLDLHISLLERHDALKKKHTCPSDTCSQVPPTKATRSLVSAPSAVSMAGVRGITRSSKQWW
jgi:hypothetical protein